MYLMPHNRALKSSSKGKVDVVVYILHQKKKDGAMYKKKIQSLKPQQTSGIFDYISKIVSI